jgi:biotin carboxyl carrier protein
MKMENAIKAENPGTVASVKVVPGQTVNQDEVLVELR